MRTAILTAALAALGAGVVGALLFWLRGSRRLGTTTQRATYATLHAASSAVPSLRSGLTAESAERAAPALRRLLGVPGVALADGDGILGADAPADLFDDVHAALLAPIVAEVLASSRPRVADGADLRCNRGADCPLRAGVAVPLVVDDEVAGVLVALAPSAGAGLLRATSEVGRFASTQLELAELDRSRTRAAEAELQFLRAQISPHFVYNALTAIAAFVRSDPERARDLLLQFADFTRYSFRSRDQYATLAEELRAVDTYLELERARFGDRLSVTLRVAPEVLSVTLPSLVLQPIVENAVRHGLEHRPGPGAITIVAEDAGIDCVITIEDDGVGMEPAQLRRRLAGVATDGVGLRNVDERLRAVFGPERGVEVETGVGAGTRVTLRVPKFRVGVRAS
jgi:two-component system LytT family sensor kinase